MDLLICLTLCLLSAAGFSSCQNGSPLDGPLNGAVGGNVVFKLANPPSEPPTTIIWAFIKDGNQNGIFGSVGGGVPDINAEYENRISVDRSTASLELRNLTLNDTGEYNLKLSITSGGVTTSLTVFERITNVQAEASQTDLVEFNSSVILTCSASGSSPSFRWLNNSAEVTGSDRVLLDKNNLTVLNVTRYDIGPYQCTASNIISAETSPSPGVTLTIAYGPDSPVVTVKPEGPYISGSNITLSCSSESSPAAQFQWALNGTLLGKEGPELRLENIQTGQSGDYSCWAYNSKTQRYKTSAPTSIIVQEKGPDGSYGGLPDWAIAVIVIVVLIGIAATIGISFYVVKQKNIPSANSRKRDDQANHFASMSASSHQDEPMHLYATTIENPELSDATQNMTKKSGLNCNASENRDQPDSSCHPAQDVPDQIYANTIEKLDPRAIPGDPGHPNIYENSSITTKSITR